MPPSTKPARRLFSEEQKTEILAFAKEHTVEAAGKKYALSHSVIYGWRHARGNGAKAPPRGVEAIALLRRAMSSITSEIRSGAPLRDSDCYVALALSTLDPPPKRKTS